METKSECRKSHRSFTSAQGNQSAMVDETDAWSEAAIEALSGYVPIG
jgi:hypothetical protein